MRHNKWHFYILLQISLQIVHEGSFDNKLALLYALDWCLIALCDELVPSRQQAITWTNDDIQVLWNNVAFTGHGLKILTRNVAIFIQGHWFENLECKLAAISSRHQCVSKVGTVEPRYIKVTLAKIFPVNAPLLEHLGAIECTCSTSHNAPFRTEMCTFLLWMVHCGMWNRCILCFVRLVYRGSFVSSTYDLCTPMELRCLAHLYGIFHYDFIWSFILNHAIYETSYEIFTHNI